MAFIRLAQLANPPSFFPERKLGYAPGFVETALLNGGAGMDRTLSPLQPNEVPSGIPKG